MENLAEVEEKLEVISESSSCSEATQDVRRKAAVMKFYFYFWILSGAVTTFVSCLCSPCLSVFRSWPEPRRAPAAVERRDRRKRAWHGRQRHKAQQQQLWRQWHGRRPGPLNQQFFFNYLLLQSRQSIAAHFSPFHRQWTVPYPQSQKRTREGAGKRAREVNEKIEVSHILFGCEHTKNMFVFFTSGVFVATGGKSVLFICSVLY